VNYRTDIDARFSNLELDDAPRSPLHSRGNPPGVPAVAPRAVRIPGSTVCETGAERATADEALARLAGFSPEPPVYAVGTLINETGHQNLRQSRRDVEELPFVREACDALVARIAAEKREDLKAPIARMRMRADGRVDLEGALFDLSERAFTLIARDVTPGGASYLSECPPALRADNLNHWLARQPEKPGTIRTRLNARTGQREIFATASARYQPFDIDELAKVIAHVAPADARGDISYDGRRARFNMLWHTPISPENAVAGEFFKAGVSLTSADDAKTGINAAAELWRNLCLNLIIVHHDSVTTGRVVHLGDVETKVRAALDSALAMTAPFAKQWGAARIENVVDQYGMDVEAIFASLSEQRLVHVPGVDPDDMSERLMRAWHVEPGYSKADIVNAITRAAHESPWARMSDYRCDATEELERQAGELLYQHVWNVEAPQIEID